MLPNDYEVVIICIELFKFKQTVYDLTFTNLRTFISLFFLFQYCCFSHAQESCDLKGEIDFPWLNYYSAYGVDDTLAAKMIGMYDSHYRKSKRKRKLDHEMRLFELVKKRSLLFNPYIIVNNKDTGRCIIYMDSASYAKTFLWNYNHEDLTANQQYLWFEAKGTWLGENAYWMTEFKAITLIEDKSRSQAGSKFAMDVYRK